MLATLAGLYITQVVSALSTTAPALITCVCVCVCNNHETIHAFHRACAPLIHMSPSFPFNEPLSHVGFIQSAGTLSAYKLPVLDLNRCGYDGGAFESASWPVSRTAGVGSQLGVRPHGQLVHVTFPAKTGHTTWEWLIVVAHGQLVHLNFATTSYLPGSDSSWCAGWRRTGPGARRWHRREKRAWCESPASCRPCNRPTDSLQAGPLREG